MITRKNNEQDGFNERSLIELMPNDTASQIILADRAKHLAIPLHHSLDNKQEINYVRFKLGEYDFYGVPYNYIKEVIMYTPPTKIPYTSECIAGVINQHGSLITVLDLKHYFYNSSGSVGAESYFIVVSVKGFTIALQVYGIDGSDVFSTTDLSPPLQIASAIKLEFILGLHKNTIALINIEALVADLRSTNRYIKESM